MFLFWIALGAFIGWAIPQPQWAADLQEKIVGWLKGLSKSA
jgi:hypothetical protein